MKRQGRIVLLGAVAAGALLALAPSGSASSSAARARLCPPNPPMGMACVLKASDVSLSANGRDVRLRVPQRYVAMQAACHRTTDDVVTCTLRHIVIGTGSGTRVVTVAAPAPGKTLQISCASGFSAKGISCRVAQKVGVTTVGG
jgi:hypothetical protein